MKMHYVKCIFFILPRFLLVVKNPTLIVKQVCAK